MAEPPETEAWLERAALHYLERYSASVAHLRRVLRRKLRRRLIRLGAEDVEAQVAAGEPAIEALVTRLQQSGMLDDRAYAETKSRTMRRQGRSARAIEAQLRARGVETALAEAARDAADAELAPEVPGQAELIAALRLARKRRLGPFADGRADLPPDKQLARMARAGFALDICRRALAMPTSEAEALLYRQQTG